MAAGIAPESKSPRAVSPFRFPPSLSAKHEEELRKRGISREFALASGVRSAADNELLDLNFQASLPHEERKKGLQGICFAYVDLELKAEATWRIKPDTTFRRVGNGRVLENSVVPNGTRYRIFFPFPGTEVPLYIHRVPDGTRLFNNGCKTFLRWALSALA